MAQSTIQSQQDEQLQKGKALLPTPSLHGTDEGGIVCFKGSKDILSNFYLDKFRHHGVLVNCVEQAYQYEKARMYGCYDIAEEIMKLRSGYLNRVLVEKSFRSTTAGSTVVCALCVASCRAGRVSSTSKS